MSEPLEPELGTDARAQGTIADDPQELDALPVLADQAQIVNAQPFAGALPSERRSPGAMMPAVQAAAVAAGGFVAGAAVVGLVHRRQRRSAALSKGRRAGRELSRGGARKTGRAGELVQIVGSRSLLVDVHLLGGPREDR